MAKRNSTVNELIPAVGYLRKSTKGIRKRDKKERQEKSLPQQKDEITKLGEGRFKIVAWYVDDGVSGWKRGAKRPDFQRMLDEVQKLGAKAVLCDNIDRFSRATHDDVQEDATALRRAGVRWIVTASHGEYDLGARNDIGEIIKFVVAVWSAHEYSRQLGRRIALARRNAAVEGKRTGGAAPFGYANDGKGGLVVGEPKQVALVRRIFDWFANKYWSLNSIANELNTSGIPAPRGPLWKRATIKEILRRKAYIGDFVFNHQGRGQFYRIGVEGVTETGDQKRRYKAPPEALFEVKKTYPPLIDEKVFAKAQERLDLLSNNPRRRKRVGYPLTGILICDHCGKPLYGCQPDREILYRCGTGSVAGTAICPNYKIRQSDILPFILQLLGQEVQNVKALLSMPPDRLRRPHLKRQEQREEAERERDKLAVQIRKAEENLLFSDDARTRRSFDSILTEMRDRLEELERQLASLPPSASSYASSEIDALHEWWEEFYQQAVRLPVKGELPREAWLHVSAESEGTDKPEVLVDPRMINEALHAIGAEVRLRWKTEPHTTTGGKEQKRHRLVRGRFRLGQQSGNLMPYVSKGTACVTIRRAIFSATR